MEKDLFCINDKGSYILVEFFGIFSLEAGKLCVDSMADSCKEYDRYKVLLDCTGLQGEMSLFDRFQVAEYGAAKRDTIKKFALLSREDMILPDNFVENVAINRGMDLRIFTDFNRAEQWLIES